MVELIQNIMKFPDKKTNFYFSISSSPSIRGSTYYNKIFLEKKKNSLYVPVSINNFKDFENFLKFLKKKIININGLSISMPFKHFSVKFADYKHASVLNSKNTNTLVFKKDKIYAYNTDYMAAKQILKKKKFKNYIILGAGSLAKTFVSLIKKENIFVFNRSQKGILNLMKSYKNIKKLDKKNFKFIKNCCLINATPFFKYSKLSKLVDFDQIKYICDCILNKEKKRSLLRKISKKKLIMYTSGETFYKIQRNFQKKIYLNEKF